MNLKRQGVKEVKVIQQSARIQNILRISINKKNKDRTVEKQRKDLTRAFTKEDI